MTSPSTPHTQPLARTKTSHFQYCSEGGVTIVRNALPIKGVQAFDALVDRLDHHQGVLLASSYEYPGRYTRIDLGFADPPIRVRANGRRVVIDALNERGEVLMPAFADIVAEQQQTKGLSLIVASEVSPRSIALTIAAPQGFVVEEERSHQPSVFSLLRAIIAHFRSADDEHLGLYGAFGYDLAFQCDPIDIKIPRHDDHRDLILFLPDELLEIDHAQRTALLVRYDFEVAGRKTEGLPRTTPETPFTPQASGPRRCDHEEGEYARNVEAAKAYFARGDLFEVVPGQTFIEPCTDRPSQIFRRLRRSTPAPYGLFLNLGEREYLVGASPEMFVRVQGRRIETCPISGTIARTNNAIGDAEQIRQLLNSEKEESELTMCTDVDRNDKSRVCIPGSVRVIGRRQIEIYSKLIHTVDHVEGYLEHGYDSLDAFITHTWAVTVTGAPKLAAMQFIEDHEKSLRSWYGGAIGKLGFDGSINTGLTLRTIRIHQETAYVRAGATLLFDSDPQSEARETELKACALLEAINPATAPASATRYVPTHGKGRTVLLVDHRDSFVHTLANYIRQSGAKVVTMRPPLIESELDRVAPDMVLLSPGPGRPNDFELNRTIALAIARNLPIFGVCLGLQGLVEYFGGDLDTLSYPVHGKPSTIRCEPSGLFDGLATTFVAGRYHSLVARRSTLPRELRVLASADDDGSIMAIEHRDLPIAAVQFHPESILSDSGEQGLRIIDNAMRFLRRKS
jgi:anthranilate synthase